MTCGKPLKGEHLLLSVRDDGRGISPEGVSLAFEPFYSENLSSDLVAVSAGWGLTMVRSVAHALGGHLLVESEPGVGTTFKVLLPKG